MNIHKYQNVNAKYKQQLYKVLALSQINYSCLAFHREFAPKKYQ